jgi:hypothetical protein
MSFSKSFIFVEEPFNVRGSLDPAGRGSKSITSRGAKKMFPSADSKKRKTSWETVVIGKFK